MSHSGFLKVLRRDAAVSAGEPEQRLRRDMPVHGPGQAGGWSLDRCLIRRSIHTLQTAAPVCNTTPRTIPAMGTRSGDMVTNTVQKQALKVLPVTNPGQVPASRRVSCLQEDGPPLFRSQGPRHRQNPQIARGAARSLPGQGAAQSSTSLFLCQPWRDTPDVSSV